MEIVRPQEIEDELNARTLAKPRKYTVQTLFPLNDLDDRSFELLIYSLAKRHASLFPLLYDTSGLSLPGGDKGRDVVLHYDRQLAGVIQCKRLKTLLDRSSIGKEILKFVLHCLNDGILLSPDRPIKYFVACSTGINREATALIEKFPYSLVSDIETLRNWCTELLEKYTSLNTNCCNSEPAIIRGLNSVQVIPVLPIDISLSITAHPEIAKAFFQLDSVLDAKTFEDIITGRTLDLPLLLKQYAPSIKNNLSRINFFGLSLNRRPREIELYSLFVTPFFRRKGQGVFVSGSAADLNMLGPFWEAKSLDVPTVMGKAGSGKTSAFVKLLLQNWSTVDLRDAKSSGAFRNTLLTVSDLLSQNSNCVVLGRPGAGKSSFIKYVMCKLADADATVFEPGDVLNRVPFRIDLNTYNVFRLRHNGGFAAFIANRMQTDNQVAYLSTNNVVALLEAYDSVIFFDGLDEVIDPIERAQVRNEIENFCRNTPRARVIVTCRPEAYSDVPFKEREFEVFDVEDFADNQILEYVNKWYTIEEPDVAMRETEIRACLSQLSTVESELRRNPLLLSLILIIYRNNLEFPTTKLEIYESCANTLVDTRDRKEKGIDVSLAVQNRVAAFSALAFWQYTLVTQGKREPTYADVVQFLKDYLLTKGECEDDTIAIEAARQFFEFARVRSLYVENSFTHKTFLEYFTATYIYSNYHTKGKFAERDRLLDNYFAEDTWNVVVELLLCKIDREQADYEVIDAIVSRQLERDPKASSAFMLHLLPYIKNISPALKRALFRTALRLCTSTDGTADMPYRRVIAARFPPLASDSRFEPLCSEVIDEAVRAGTNIGQLLIFLLESAIHFPPFARLVPAVIPEDIASDPYVFILLNFPALISTAAVLEHLKKFNTNFGLRRSLIAYHSQYGGEIFAGSSRFSWIPRILFTGENWREIEVNYGRLRELGYRPSMIKMAIEKDTGRVNFNSAIVEECFKSTKRSELKLILRTALRRYWRIFVQPTEEKQPFYIKRAPSRRFPIPK